jgi:hypothetical protein
MSCPVLPALIELPQTPQHDGKFVEISFNKLGDSLSWLNESVDLLSKGLKQVHQHLQSQEELWKRLEQLENKPPPEAQIIREEAPQVHIEIPYIPSNEDISGIASKVASPIVEEKVTHLRIEVNDKFSPLEQRIKVLEDIEANRKDPLARMQQYFQEIGFLPYGEPEESDPLVLLGQVFVLLRQDIAMCPKIKDLEDAEAALRSRIAEVEDAAAADREEKARKAAAESAKIREDLEKVAKQVQGLIQKNLEDGDLAGALRDLTLRVDKIEDLLRKKEEVKIVEEPVVVEKPPREKGFLEKLGEVDLQEEVRRLRSMVECMEAAMPYETRQTMEYLRNGKTSQDPSKARESSPSRGNLGNSGTLLPAQSEQLSVGVSGTLSGTLQSGGADIRQETEDQLQRFRQTQSRELQHVMKVMKNQERTIEALDTKVLDLWKRLPKVLALLEPLQAQMETTMSGDMQQEIVQDSTGGPQKSVSFAPLGIDGSTGGPGDINLNSTNVFIGSPGSNEKNAEMPISQAGQMPIGQLGPSRQLPAVQPSHGLSKGRKDFLTGFVPIGEGTGGTGEPLREMGSLTGLIKLALQRTTDDIHADLMKELLRFRQEFVGRLDLKADKTELIALLGRVEELSKKTKRMKEFHSFNKDRGRSLSPPLDQAADTRNDATATGDARQASPPSPGKPFTTSASSPNLSDRKKGHSCHENCKVPTCPRAMQMQQSLSRLPALKVVQ